MACSTTYCVSHCYACSKPLTVVLTVGCPVCGLPYLPELVLSRLESLLVFSNHEFYMMFICRKGIGLYIKQHNG